LYCPAGSVGGQQFARRPENDEDPFSVKGHYLLALLAAARGGVLAPLVADARSLTFACYFEKEARKLRADRREAREMIRSTVGTLPSRKPAMPSPFPGMDPYLEAPHIWPDLHDALAAEMRSELNRTLPSPYYARLEMRPELGIVEERRVQQRIVPDVAVVRHPRPVREQLAGGAAVLTTPRSVVSKFIEYEVLTERIRHHFVEIRDSSEGHKLITLIEIVSPSNKRPGPDRQAYERKQRDVLDSDANLIELDLLRDGRRILPDLNLEALIEDLPEPMAYLVLVNKVWRRIPGATAYQVFPIGLREWLPCIPVPLKETEAEITLDLQFVFNRAYDTGPYRRGAVNYAGDPAEPPLGEKDAAWAAELTRPWRERAPADPHSLA
jgi:hypothetical protein